MSVFHDFSRTLSNYSKSGNVEKYEEGYFSGFSYAYNDGSITEGTHFTMCGFHYSPTISYVPTSLFNSEYAYYTYTYTMDKSTGNYSYTFIAYAQAPSLALNASYIYCAKINGVQDKVPDTSTYAYYKEGMSYIGNFVSYYNPNHEPSLTGTKLISVQLSIVSYWNPRGGSGTYTTYYTKKITFAYDLGIDETSKEFVGVYLFSISSPGSFIGSESDWEKLSLKSLATFTRGTMDAETGAVSGYVTCSGTSLETATLTVYTESITSKSSAIASKTVNVSSTTIYVIGIARYKDTTVGVTTRYRYVSSLIATLTKSSWSTTRPSL